MAQPHPMRRIALRSLAAHKVRFLLTLLAVALGTSFVSGSFILTNSLSKTFDSLFDQELSNVSAVITPSEAGQDGLPLSQLDEIRQQPGVLRVNINQEQPIIVANDRDEALQTGGAPSVVRPYYPDGQSVRSTKIVEGNAPTGPAEVLINSGAAERHHIAVGDTVKLVDRSKQQPATVTGVYEMSTETGGYVGLMMDAPAFAEQWTNGTSRNGVLVSASEGTTDGQLVTTLKKAYPEYSVTTGKQMADDMSDQVNKALSFVNYFLIAFGLIALVVGTFIIANTFAMIVAQRMREFALLRSLGVSQQQITGSVVFEATAIGVLGSALGVLAGVGLVHVIYAVMSSTGFGMPTSSAAVSVASVAVPLVLGTLVTVFSAWLPARKAGSVRPVAAMRAGDSSSSSLLLRSAVGAVGIAVGVGCAVAAAMMFDDWATSRRAILLGFGALGLILGTFLAGPVLAASIVPVIGRAVGLPFGAVGRLAATNSRRNPRRTATTAFALTLGVALVTSFGMLGATMKSTVADITDSTIRSDFLITGAGSAGGTFPLSDQIADAAAQVSGVSSVATWGMAPVTIAGHSSLFGGQGQDAAGGAGANAGGAHGNPAAMGGASTFYKGDFARSVGLNLTEGSADASQPGVLVDRAFAEEMGWSVGQQVPMEVPGVPVGFDVPVTGLYEANQVVGSFVIAEQSFADFAQHSGTPGGLNNKAILAIFVNSDPNADSHSDNVALKQRLVDATKPFIVAQVVTPQEYAGQQAVMIDQMLSVLYALLALSIVVAVLGIINTLALNVIERRQEIGMLRAVGTHRGQVRRLITLEAVQIALFGAVIGVVIGLVLGWAFITVLADDGLGDATYPWATIAGMLVGSAAVGIVAAMWPAVKASRTPPLDAISD